MNAKNIVNREVNKHWGSESCSCYKSTRQARRKIQLQFMGHFNTIGEIEKLIFVRTVLGKRCRGTQRQLVVERWNSWAWNYRTNATFTNISNNKEDWRSAVCIHCCFWFQWLLSPSLKSWQWFCDICIFCPHILLKRMCIKQLLPDLPSLTHIINF